MFCVLFIVGLLSVYFVPCCPVILTSKHDDDNDDDDLLYSF